MLSSLLVMVSSSLLTAETSTFTYEAGLLVETRNSTTVASGQEAQTTGELGLTPRLALEVEGRSDLYRFSYLPRIFGQVNALSNSVELLHQASLSARWEPTADWQVLGSVDAAYGLVDQLALPHRTTDTGGGSTQPSSGTQTVNPSQSFSPMLVLKEVIGEGMITVEHRPTARWRLQGRGGFSVNGGADANAQKTVPLHYGPRLGAEIEWKATPFDALVTSATGSATRYLRKTPAVPLSSQPPLPPNGEYTLDEFVREVTLIETWQHRFSSTVQTWIGAGTTFVDFEGIGQTTQLALHPNGEMGVRRDSPLSDSGWSTSLSARLWAAQDALTGLVSERLDVNVSAGTWLSRRWRLEGRGTGGVVVEKGSQYGDTLADSELRLTFLPQPDLRIAGGLRVLGQHLALATNGSLIQWGFFLELDYTIREQRRAAPPETAPPR
jgi:hypothetical protein